MYTQADFGINSLCEVELRFEGKRWEHTHPDFQLIAVIEGSLDLVIEGCRQSLGPDTLVVVPARARHFAEANGQSTYASVLDLRVIDTPWNALGHHLEGLVGEPRVMPAGLAPQTARQLRDAMNAGVQRLAKVMAALWGMLASTIPCDDLPAAPANAIDVRLQLCDWMMRDGMARPGLLQTLPGRLDLSSSQLTRLYRRNFGVTPGARLRKIRLEAAEKMLRHTTLPIKQIAFRCGLVSANTFIRLFQARYATTPRKHRMNTRNAVRPAGDNKMLGDDDENERR